MWLKLPDFKVIRRLPAKSRLKNQYLCGGVNGTVEMNFTRYRVLTQNVNVDSEGAQFCRNELHPLQGIDTENSMYA